MDRFAPAILLDGQWRPAIGDPTPWGWAIVTGYYLAAAVCAWNAARARANGVRLRPWLALTLIALVLALNKNFDLASWAWLHGRQLAMDLGWYPIRGWVQIGAMGVGFLLAFGIPVMTLGRVRPVSPALWVTLFGAILCASLVAVRALSFHGIDTVLGARIGGLSVSRGTELTGILIMVTAALVARIPAQEPQP